MPKRNILAALVLAAVFATLAVATRLGPAEPPGSSPASTPATAGSASASPTPTAGWLPPLAVTVTRDVDRYAASVAELVFAMDTRTRDPGDYRAALLAAADPALSSTGRADLVRTVEERIPTADVWARMPANAQYSTWATTQVSEPGTWAQVVTGGQAQPGWVMRNVTGIQDSTGPPNSPAAYASPPPHQRPKASSRQRFVSPAHRPRQRAAAHAHADERKRVLPPRRTHGSACADVCGPNHVYYGLARADGLESPRRFFVQPAEQCSCGWRWYTWGFSHSLW